MGMKHLGVPFTLGSGVAAAQQWFIDTHAQRGAGG
jgi:hypothetical protein